MGLFDELLERPKEENRMFSVITGIVRENWDKEHPGQVKVEYFLGEKGKSGSSWVPVAMPYIWDKAGMYFLPEVGSEVVVAFQMGDRNSPIVIGSLWNKEMVLPEKTANEKNSIKKIRTKGGHEIIFSEEEKKEYMEIHTPGAMTVSLSDEKKEIAISDADKKNRIFISGEKGTVTVDGEKKLELSIGGQSLVTLEKDKVTITAGTISLKAKQSLKLQGQTTDIKGSSVQIKADGSLKAESSGVAQIKGSMVKIN